MLQVLAVTVTFTLGLTALLADPSDEQPGGFCRDELLFHICDVGIELSPTWEVREVLSADLPMASGSEDDRGDLVVIAAKDGVGGPLKPEAAAHLLRVHASTPNRATVDMPASSLGMPPRAILVPDRFMDTEFEAGKHPFAGIGLRSARRVRDMLRASGAADLAAVTAMLNLCAVHGFVVAAVESADG